MQNSFNEYFDELSFTAAIQPQIVRIRKINMFYPEWSTGLIAVVTGGKKFDNDCYFSVKFYPFAEENITRFLRLKGDQFSLYYSATIKHREGYWMPIIQHGKFVIDTRYKPKPYYGKL